MKKYLFITVSVGLLLSGLSAIAQPNVTLTPTSLFDMIEKQGEKIEKLVNIATRNNIRVQALESKVQNLDEELSAEVDSLNKAVGELQRKVAGMQKQITVLHAKKANK